MSPLFHQPVMLQEVVTLLAPRPGGKYVDLTLGAGGHAKEILKRCAPDGQLLGLDRDSMAIGLARQTLSCFGSRLVLVQGLFSELPNILSTLGWAGVDGVVADLGMSSMQLDNPQRGFSFQQLGPLDMRMDSSGDTTLATLLSQLNADELSEAMTALADIKKPRQLARRLLDAYRQGRCVNTLQLASLVSERRTKSRIHPATRVFMALRMMVNREIDELSSLLGALPDPLFPGGRIVMLAFHSVEDRLIKERFRSLSGKCTCSPGLPTCLCGQKTVMRRLTTKACRPGTQEVKTNPRARSARLRAAQRLVA